MESIQSKLYKFLLRLINSKEKIKKEFAVGKFDAKDCPKPPPHFYSKFDIQEGQVNGRPVFSIQSHKSTTKTTVLYLHGGAYIHNMAKHHWQFIRNLVDKTGCTVVVPDYPLAPTHTYKDAFMMVLSIYKDLLRTVNSKNIVLIGDSAGGGFALALAQKLHIDKITHPAQIILLSPWLDVSLTNPNINELDKNDPFLSAEGLKMAARAYAGNSDLTHHLISPIYGQFHNIGKISVFTGSHDILAADARKFRDIAKVQGVEINYYEYPKMIHVWMILNMPEARKALDEIATLIEQTH